MKHWKKKVQEPEPDESVPYHIPKQPADVEMTSYALMAYMALASHDSVIGDGLPIVKWLSSQRNSLGGFYSTQDTVVGLQALAAYASLVYGGGTDLEVTTSASNLPEVEITDANSLVLHQQEVEVPGSVSYSVTGKGCALIQVREARIKNTGHFMVFYPAQCPFPLNEICLTYRFKKWSK